MKLFWSTFLAGLCFSLSACDGAMTSAQSGSSPTVTATSSAADDSCNQVIATASQLKKEISSSGGWGRPKAYSYLNYLIGDSSGCIDGATKAKAQSTLSMLQKGYSLSRVDLP